MSMSYQQHVYLLIYATIDISVMTYKVKNHASCRLPVLTTKYKNKINKPTWHGVARKKYWYDQHLVHNYIGFILHLSHRHLSNIGCLKAHTACLVCFISTVNGHSEKRKTSLERPALVAGT
jgi:hypothetical protein